MRTLAVLVVAAAGLCACTPMQWVKPDVADPEQVRLRRAGLPPGRRARGAIPRLLGQQPMLPYVVGPGRVVWPYGAYADPYAHQLMQENRLAQSAWSRRATSSRRLSSNDPAFPAGAPPADQSSTLAAASPTRPAARRSPHPACPRSRHLPRASRSSAALRARIAERPARLESLDDLPARRFSRGVCSLRVSLLYDSRMPSCLRASKPG